MDFLKHNHAQLDAHYAEHARVAIDGWSKMKVAAKRLALAFASQPALAKRAAIKADADRHINAPVKFKVGSEKIAAFGPPNIDALEDAPKDTVTITITDAQSNPVALYVHGVGSWSLRIGETYSLPVDAVSALRNSDVKFDEV